MVAERRSRPKTSAYGSLYFTVTGFHGAHVVAGLLMNLVVQFWAWRGFFSARRHELVSNAALYWPLRGRRVDCRLHLPLSDPEARLMVGAAAVPGSRPDRDAASHPAPHSAAVGRGSLWFGLFGAPFFWSVQLIATYAVAAHTCFPQRVPLVTSSSPAAWNAGAVVIGVALIGSVAALSPRWRIGGPRGPRQAVRTPPSGWWRWAHPLHVVRRDHAQRAVHRGVVLSALALFLTPVCW